MSVVTIGTKPGYLSSRIRGIAKQYLPRRFKRFLFISTVAGLVTSAVNPDRNVERQLNEIFKLASTDRSITAGMAFSSIIWKNLSPEISVGDRVISLVGLSKSKSSPEDIAIAGNHLARNIPDWLQYGSFDLMVNDAVKVIRNATPSIG